MKRILSLLLVVLTLVSAIPLSVNAEEADYENYYDDKPSWKDYTKYRYYYSNSGESYDTTSVTVYLTDDYVKTKVTVDKATFPEISNRIKDIYSVSREPNAFILDFLPYYGTYENYSKLSKAEKQVEIEDFIAMVEYLYSLDFVSTVIIPYSKEFSYSVDLVERYPSYDWHEYYLEYDNENGEKTEGFVTYEIRVFFNSGYLRNHYVPDASVIPELEDKVVRIKKGHDHNEFIFCLKVYEYDSKNPYQNLTEKEIYEFVAFYDDLWKKYAVPFYEGDICDIFPNWITIPKPEAEAPVEPGVTIIPGDIFGTNGRVNAADCNMLKQFIAGNVDETMINILNADVNGDGKINSKDSLVLTKMVRGS